MIRFENEVTIDQSVDKVFEYVADLEKLPTWNYFVQSVSKTSSGPTGPGSSYHQVRKEDEQNLRIKEFVPNRLLIIETIPPSKPQLKREMVFERDAGKTRIIDSWELELGLPGIIEKLSKKRVRSAVHENLSKLKRLLETESVTLQDGRSFNLSG
jgi:uncharacterized membrane protein